MSKQRNLVVAMAAGLALMSASVGFAAEPAASKNPVLVQYKGVKVTQSDLEKFVDMEVPKEQQAAFWGSEQNIRQMTANLFITKVLAQEARQEGIEKKDAWAVNYFAERGLMLLKLKADVQKKMDATNFEALAKEYYTANPKAFDRPEEVKAAHILISTKDMSDADALAKANEVLAKVKAHPEDFAKLADEYSQDPSVKQNHGDLGYFAKNQMVKPFADAAFAMTKPGEIAGPIKSQFGYHIIQFEGSRPATTIPFSEVKAQLIAQQKSEMAKKYQMEAVERVKSLKGIETNQIAVNNLLKPLPVPKMPAPAEAKPAEPAPAPK